MIIILIRRTDIGLSKITTALNCCQQWDRPSYHFAKLTVDTMRLR